MVETPKRRSSASVDVGTPPELKGHANGYARKSGGKGAWTAKNEESRTLDEWKVGACGDHALLGWSREEGDEGWREEGGVKRWEEREGESKGGGRKFICSISLHIVPGVELELVIWGRVRRSLEGDAYYLRAHVSEADGHVGPRSWDLLHPPAKILNSPLIIIGWSSGHSGGFTPSEFAEYCRGRPQSHGCKSIREHGCKGTP
ncbi:hypothetical protein DFH09DRAFT_1106063 [Mycena vulgaris]|nr:hypothetical protein DFH09DRAFT_1106063 [Mycena vulgaris]